MAESRQIYFDFSKDVSTITNNDIAIQENEWAVVESIDNILTNEPYSQVYQKRRVGARLSRFLFEPIDTITGLDILEEVENAIALFETRAKNVIVKIIPMVEENTFKIDISCEIDESDRILTISNTLEKLR